MNKFNLKRKAIALSLGLAAMMLLATNLTAQNGGGIFERGFVSDNVESNNRDGGIGLGGAQSEDPTSPLGSGIAILTAIGAGYALLKRKEDKQ